MMKKLMVLAALVLVGGALRAETAEISFSFSRLGGHGTNQFAVWIEDEAGNYIKTLLATRFTVSEKGWTTRPASLPVWIEKSKRPEMARAEIDALTGSTPQTGKLAYQWDFTDKGGAKVKAGKYKIILQATLRDENQVIYSAEIQSDPPSDRAAAPLAIETKYFVQSGPKEAAGPATGTTADREMIRDVRVVVGE
jgi:hypothetical protein